MLLVILIFLSLLCRISEGSAEGAQDDHETDSNRYLEVVLYFAFSICFSWRVILLSIFPEGCNTLRSIPSSCSYQILCFVISMC